MSNCYIYVRSSLKNGSFELFHFIFVVILIIREKFVQKKKLLKIHKNVGDLNIIKKSLFYIYVLISKST